MALLSALLEILERPTIGDVMLFMTPIWVAVLVGVLVGWAWKPKWASVIGVGDVDGDGENSNLDCKQQKEDSNWCKGMVLLQQLCSSFGSIPSLNFMKIQLPSCISWLFDNGFQRVDSAAASSSSSASDSKTSSLELQREKSSLVAEDDLKHLHQLVEETDGGPAWIQMMDRSTKNMSYQAWRRDPEVALRCLKKTGPPQYCSRTIYEDATPEMLRDFFWDDEFRMKWDDMLVHAETLEDCDKTGTMVVQWVRKFPFFCSDREYIIGRRIWDAGQTYYCVTKGVPRSSVPRRNKPRRVDLYYSSWCIRTAESKKDGQPTACEVILFHHEDMGIPWEIAKLGVKQGMWGAVKKIDPGLRAYQKHRASGAPLSRCATMAQIYTKVTPDYVRSLESSSNTEIETIDSPEKPAGRNIPKALVVGGAIVLACSLDRGLLTKAVIFGVARRFANIGGRRL